jgi:hypothetical protein
VDVLALVGPSVTEPNDVIEAAIDRVEAQVEQPVEFRVDIPIFPEPLRLTPEDIMTFNVPPGVDGPMLLILVVDAQRFRGVQLPTETTWQLRRVESVPPKPGLWVPGGKVQ